MIRSDHLKNIICEIFIQNIIFEIFIEEEEKLLSRPSPQSPSRIKSLIDPSPTRQIQRLQAISRFQDL